MSRYPHLQNIVVFSFADHCVVLTVAGAAAGHMRLTLMLFLRDLTRSRGRGSAVTTRALSRGEQRIGGSSNTVYIAVSSRQIRFHETQMLKILLTLRNLFFDNYEISLDHPPEDVCYAPESPCPTRRRSHLEPGQQEMESSRTFLNLHNPSTHFII